MTTTVVTGAQRGPRDPIAAATDPDPYPYYDRLVSDAPLYRDETLGLWFASGSQAVHDVLTSELCRVRPASEPVPRSIAGSPAGEIFRHLVRMNDGVGHCPFKQAVSATLDSLNPLDVSAAAARWAGHLAREIGPGSDPQQIVELAFALPVYVIATQLGAEESALPEVARLVGDLVRCFSPSSTPEETELGKRAADRLLELFQAEMQRTKGTATLLAALAEQAQRFGRNDPVVVLDNAIGFMTQAYEATAGLIGNTLLALAQHPDVLQRLQRDPEIIDVIAGEVLRYDSPVQNTRRFVAEDGNVAGRAMKRGETVLVLLAAANRDPLANPDPHRFDETRRDPRIFTFGAGPHACPGQSLATSIAVAGVLHLLRQGVEPARFAPRPAYRPSGNTRVPSLAWRTAADEGIATRRNA